MADRSSIVSRAIAPSDRTRLVLNAGVNWLGTIAQMVAVFWVAPILVHGLGDERYGVWALVESILAYLTLFDLGIGAAVVRYVARFEGIADIPGVNKTFSASLSLFTLAGLAVLGVVGLMLGPLWSWMPVPSEFRYEAWWQLAILSFNLAIGLPMGVFAAVLDGLQRYAPKTIVRIATLVLRSIAMVVVVRHGGGLMMIALTVTAIALVEHLILAGLGFWFLPGLRFQPRLVDRDALRMIGSYSLNAFLAMIAGRISFQSDALVIAAFLPLSQITVFALPARLCEYAKNALRSMTTVLTPHFSKLEGQAAYQAIRETYLTGTRWVLWIAIPLQFGLWALGKPFFSLWLGASHAERCYPVLFVLATPLALALSQSISGRLLYGIGRLRSFTLLVSLEAVTNLLLSLLLVSHYGVVGVAIGTAVPNVLLNLAVARHTYGLLGLDLWSYFRDAWGRPLLASLAPALFWATSEMIFPVDSWISFFSVGLAGCVLQGALFACVELDGITKVIGAASSPTN